ncbi:MAG: hypothetical protein CM1200mP27_08940 [Chloroflexota bacterium]|nr:MAG: hypothetical protein CM1200mP27_08940 [Chloroflexota bacterium]
MEMRPSEEGRMVVVKRNSAGEVTDITPKPFSARTKVHEYGGVSTSSMTELSTLPIFPINAFTREDDGGEPVAITPEGDVRYADGCFDYTRNRIICVREDHTGEENRRTQ